MFSAVDFAGFSEDDFWSGLSLVAKDFPEDGERYRQLFARAESEWPNGTLAVFGPASGAAGVL
jgi:hypothetical protein